MTDCVTDPETGCTDCPFIPEVPEVPAHIDVTALIGWNAGANSITILGGDVHTIMAVPPPAGGVVIGLKGERTRNTIPELVEHGLWFQSLAGRLFISVVEFGTKMTPNFEITEGQSFEIRRRRGVVSYRRGTVEVYRSARPSSGAKMVNACLYMSGDTVE